MCVEWGLKNM